MISVTIPGKANAEKRKFIADALSLQEDDVFLVMDQDVCWLDCQYRFQENSANSVILHLIKYIEAVPNDKGLQFLKSLSTSTQWEAKAHTKDLTQAITKLETSLSIPKK